ncbi:MAG TPA: SIR2 family protein [Solirubrobacteraceae bacterium]|jgi:hypothetical protein
MYPTDREVGTEVYSQLANALIARHIRVSAQNSEVRDWLAEQEIDHYPIDLVESRMRCIIVVGAGASAPLLARGDDLATRLEGVFGRDTVELERLKLVNNLDPDAFETRLIAISKTPDAARQVKSMIAQEYNVHQPTLLAYELIAHLLKHRFVDAIVSFNFDELLDRSLDDELAATEYRRIVSERDCKDVQPNADATDYVPLYVKLHGTASEPDSLRFTPESYYTLPAEMVNIVQDLLHVDRCVIVNVGSGLASFDFQRLLGIPRNLHVYDLSFADIDPNVQVKIDEERRRSNGNPAPGDDGPERTFDWLHKCANRRDECNEHLKNLCSVLDDEAREIVSPVGQLVRFRSVRRHEVVARLLGPGSHSGHHIATGRWTQQDEIDYLRKRAILELSFAGAKARGLISLVPLARDRPARYYELYKHRMDGHGMSWTSLCSAAGLIDSDTIPDVLESVPHLRSPPPMPAEYTEEDDPTHRLHEFSPEALAHHVVRRIKNPSDEDDVATLQETIDELQHLPDVELHTQDDRVCSKAFKQPITLRTTSALKIYTWLMIDNLEPEDHVYVSAETGGWLLEDAITRRIKDQEKLKVLLAFGIDVTRLREAYPGRNLKLRCLNPWHHNRHVTIVCKRDRPIRAIYFARHLRTPVITAVYLDSIRDVAHLVKTFDARWREAERCRR